MYFTVIRKIEDINKNIIMIKNLINFSKYKNDNYIIFMNENM